jgi:hypothetical protein
MAVPSKGGLPGPIGGGDQEVLHLTLIAPMDEAANGIELPGNEVMVMSGSGRARTCPGRTIPKGLLILSSSGYILENTNMPAGTWKPATT